MSDKNQSSNNPTTVPSGTGNTNVGDNREIFKGSNNLPTFMAPPPPPPKEKK